ncbi:MAG TPA: cytochrome c-type biogenesis protein CcmH [Gemmatimonadales bacterium]
MIATLLSTVLAAASVSAQVPGAEPTDSTLRAAPPSSDVTEANKLLGTLMSPFCPGLTLANCPSAYAETLRVSVRGRLDAGEEPDSIVESLVAAFGEGMRGAPRAAGLGLVL